MGAARCWRTGLDKRMCTPCQKCKLWDEHLYKNLDDQKKYFLVLMMGDFQDGMIIPEELVRHLKGEIPEKIKLQTRNDQSHIIAVAKNQEKLVLTVGWSQFVESYDLQMGDTIIFKYNGNSEFSVIIFDKLGCEKALSAVVDPFLPPVQERRTNATETVKKDSFSSEDGHGLEDLPGSNYTVRKKKMRLSSIQKEHLKDGYITTRKTKLTLNQMEEVKQKIHSIHSEIPIFVAVMGKSNIDSKCFLTFPSHYAEKYLREETRLYLQLLGKEWEVSVTDNSARHEKKLGSGWQKFVKDNNLKMGDICLFELLSNESRCTMEVYIIRVNDSN
ncbi:hypothetical protein ACQ4PT_045752 [Festuca glaucescens]